MKHVKSWKRNAVAATVILFVCAGIYLNWSYTQKTNVPDLTEVLNMEDQDEEQILVMNDEVAEEINMNNENASDYFASVRLSRQESRDEAVSLLQETMAYEDVEENRSKCAESLNEIVTTALDEAEIESLLVAKGYADCVTYISEDVVSVAVSGPEEGLTPEDVALISDVVTSQTSFDLSNVRVIEVK